MSTSPNKVAIVTGGSRGIGKAISLQLAADGFAVVVNYAGNRQAADETVASIEAAGGRAVACQADVSQPDDVTALYDAAVTAFGKVNVVVNNAGVMSLTPIGMDGLADFDRNIMTNLRGTYVMMAQAAERLERGGRFIALSTSVIAKSLPNYGPYIASKAGVEGLVKVFANELRGREICVNAVAPGPVGTELFFEGKSEAFINQLISMVPLERLGTPEDIARVVAFLAGPEGGWVNGQIIRANGGFA